jgi:hypothetical protein
MPSGKQLLIVERCEIDDPCLDVARQLLPDDRASIGSLLHAKAVRARPRQHANRHERQDSGVAIDDQPLLASRQMRREIAHVRASARAEIQHANRIAAADGIDQRARHSGGASGGIRPLAELQPAGQAVIHE